MECKDIIIRFTQKHENVSQKNLLDMLDEEEGNLGWRVRQYGSIEQMAHSLNSEIKFISEIHLKDSFC